MKRFSMEKIEEQTRRLPNRCKPGKSPFMANILAFLFAGIALLLAIPAAIPFLGWANWIILPIAIIGVICGAISSSNSGRNFALIVTALCILRLWVGGGLI